MKSQQQRAPLEQSLHARKLLGFGLALATGALGLCQASAAQSPVTPAAQTQLPVSLNAVMVALTDRSAEPYWNATQKRPRTQKDWDFVQYYATDIALAGVVIAYPGTGQLDATWVQNPDWQRRARMLTTIGMRALAAAKAKDQKGMQQAGNQLVQLCNDCHMQFKPEIPTQGIIMHSEYYNPELYGKSKK
jgi:hypothetical protein